MEKSEKSKVKRIAWFVLIVFVFVGGLIFYNDSNLKYNNDIKSAYVETVEEDFETKLRMDMPYRFANIDINNIRFGEADRNGMLPVDVYYTGSDNENHAVNVWAIYNLAVKYYNALVEADNSGDMMKYVEALNTCLQNMEFVEDHRSYYSNNLELDENQAKQFNEIFSGELGENQVGFLPYFIELIDIKDISEGNYNAEYKFKLKGFSFAKNPNGEIKLPNIEGAILTLNSDKDNVDVYEQEFEICFKINTNEAFLNGNMVFKKILSIYMKQLLDVSFNLNCLNSQKIDLTEKFIKMTMDQYNFEKMD